MNQILRKWKLKIAQFNISDSNTAVLVFGICNILQKCVPYILMPFMTRYLSTEEYGIYSVYNAWVIIISVVATLNLHLGGFNNGLCKYSYKSIDYTTSIISLSNFITIIIFSILFIGQAFWLEVFNISTPLLILMFAYIIGVQGFNCWIAKARYEYRFKSLIRIMILNFCSSLLLPLLSMFLGQTLFDLILAMQLPNICIGLGCFIYCLIVNKFKITLGYWLEALRFNLPLLPHYISGIILNQIDRVMIQKICGDEKVAMYSVAYSLSSAMNLLVNSINSAILPNIYHALTDKNYAKVKKQISSYLQIFEAGVLAVILIMPEVLVLLASDTYKDSINAIPPIVISSYFLLLYNLFANVEFYYESKYFISFASIIAAISNLVLNAIFIPKYGYCAAAYTTGICYCIYAFMHMGNTVILSKKYNIEAIFDYRKIILTVTRLIIFTGIIIMLYDKIIIRYIVFCLIIVICIYKVKRTNERNEKNESNRCNSSKI